MGIYSWDLGSGFIAPLPEPLRNPRLTVRREYSDTSLPARAGSRENRR